jgi:hypothetical protein
MGRVGKRRGGPWWSRFRDRVTFDAEARHEHPDLRASKHSGTRDRGLRYCLQLEVPHYQTVVDVEILFRVRDEWYPRVRVTPSDYSPHRFSDGSLCIWHRRDPNRERTWVVADGLLALIDLIRVHLFKEAWWREYGEWLGPQVSHGSSKR